MFFTKKVKCDYCNQEYSIKKCKELKCGYLCDDCYEKLQESNIINHWFNLKRLTIQDIVGLVNRENQEVDVRPIINAPLVLKDGEVCYYYGEAESFNIKNIITRYESVGGYAGIRIMKGVTIGRSQSVRVPIREDVEERYPAKFFITNKRLVLIADKYGFDLDINKITSVEMFRNGFKYTYKDKPRYVLSNDYKYIIRLFSKLAEIVK